MHKFSFVLVFLLLLVLSACADPASPLEDTATPMSEPIIAINPTITPTVEVSPTETAPPTITLVDQYPLIISASDLFNQVITVDPADAQRIAYCAPGEIRVSLDAGQTWEAVSSSAVSAAVQAHGYALFHGEPNSKDACLSVTLNSRNPDSYFAVFSTAHEEYGAPPVIFMGFYTTDGGETWQLVQPPEDATLEDFGGFWNLGEDSIQAQFFPADYWNLPPDETLITETADGGQTWQVGEITCPAFGPCLRWGPAVSSIPGMGSPLPQSIFYSPDEGDTWSVIDPPVELRAPAPNQLVVTSDSQVLIISGSINLSAESPAVRISRNAGVSWQPITLPTLSAEDISVNYYPGLQYLTNHTYLSQGPEESTWFWLQPDMPLWCPVNMDQLPLYPVLLQSVGKNVWWVNPETQQAEHFSLSQLICAVE